MTKRIVIMVLVILLTAGMVVADYVVIHDVALTLLYFVPVGLCAWYFNRWVTLFLCGVIAVLRSLYAFNPCPHFVEDSHVTPLHWCYDYLAGMFIHMVFYSLWGMVIGLMRRQREYIEKLGWQSVTDPLTGLYTRSFMRARLREEKTRAERHKRSLTLLMMDIDRFKAFNDAKGHRKGDDVLVEIAGILRKGVRDIDVVCRYGDAEFLILLLETDKDEGTLVAEKLRAAVADALFAKSPPMTISIGVANYPRDASSAELMVRKADSALHKAKNSGHNYVCTA
jgi:diguanylate cyclase (GGDEF)-like protein